jgi:hypothetical protein
VLLSAAVAAASADGIQFSGYVDTSFNYNLTRPQDRVNKYHPYHTLANSFGLGNVHLAATGPEEGIASYVVEIDSGMYAGVNSGVEGRFFDIQEAYGTLQIEDLNDAVLRVGKFVTYEGIEVIESPSNPVITHGILYSWAEPFTHTGATLTVPIGDKFSVAVGLINGWDLVEDNNESKMLVGRLGGDYGYLTWGASGYFGKELVGEDEVTRLSADLTGAWTVNDDLSVNFQGNFGQDDLDGETGSWMGVGLQPVYALSEKVSLSARGEFFDDGDFARTKTDEDEKKGITGHTLISLAGCVGYQAADMTRLRLEVRLDSSDEEVFLDNDGEGTKSQLVGTVQFVQSF